MIKLASLIILTLTVSLVIPVQAYEFNAHILRVGYFFTYKYINAPLLTFNAKKMGKVSTT